MRILTLTNTYPPHYFGGYELTCRDVMERFSDWGHTPVVLTSNVRVPGVDDLVEPEVLRTLIPYWDWQTSRSTIPRSLVRCARIERHNQRQMADAIAYARPDVVSVWHMGALSLSMLSALEDLGLPVVLTIANDWLGHAPRLDGWQRIWRRWPLPWPASVGGVPVRLPSLTGATASFVSEFTKARNLESGFWKFPDATVVRPGVDLNDFPITQAVPRDWRWQLLYVGRIDETKGVETLLRAFAGLPAEARVDLFGGGNEDYQRSMRQLATDLGLEDRVSFGLCTRAELRQRYLASDAVIFPSEWDEPFGLVPVEAMACGTPVVATGTGGSSEFLQDGVNCSLFSPGHADELAAAVCSLASDPLLRAHLIRGGQATARQLTIDHYAEALIALHVEAAGP